MGDNLKSIDKILNLHHNDLDGHVCAILMKQAFENVKLSECAFYEIDDVLNQINFKDYDWVVMTDLHPEKTPVNDLPKNLIILDHHASAKHLHNPNEKRFILTEHCGADLTKAFLEKKMKLDLSKFDELVRLTNDYDLWLKKDPKSWELQQLFDKYRYDQRFIRMFADGHCEWTSKEKAYITYRRNLLQQAIDNLEIYESDKIHGCIIQAEDYINDLCDYLLRKKGYKIVISLNGAKNTVSVRQRLETVDIGDILKDLDFGGGHPKAAGMSVTSFEDARMKIVKLENYLSDNVLEFRK